MNSGSYSISASAMHPFRSSVKCIVDARFFFIDSVERKFYLMKYYTNITWENKLFIEPKPKNDLNSKKFVCLFFL